MLSKGETSRERKEGIELKMNGEEVDMWSERHVGSLALTRTILGFLNLLLAVVVVFKLFEVI